MALCILGLEIEMSEKEIEIESRKLLQVINSLVDGKISVAEFEKQYPSVLNMYEEVIDGQAWPPLGELVPLTKKKNINLWWQDSISWHLRSVFRLIVERFFSIIPFSLAYSRTRSESKFRDICKKALERLPIEIENGKSKAWIQDNLVNEVSFTFFLDKDQSKFGDYKVIYSAKIDNESFLLSALNGNLDPLKSQYGNILDTLRTINKSRGATWLMCSEPDGALALISPLSSFDSPFSDYSKISRLEQTSGDEVQWGTCNLILLSQDRKWMLRHVYKFDRFEIELHGETNFLDKVLNSLNA